MDIRLCHPMMVLAAGLFFFLVTPQTAQALTRCPCFDLGHLHSLFYDNKNAYCHQFTRNFEILKVQIIGGGDIATSTHNDCAMTVNGVTISREHDSPFVTEHNHCTDIILSTCHSLRLKMIESR